MRTIILNQIDPISTDKVFLKEMRKENPYYRASIIGTYTVVISKITCLKALDDGTYLRLACGLELYVIDEYSYILEKIHLC